MCARNARAGRSTEFLSTWSSASFCCCGASGCIGAASATIASAIGRCPGDPSADDPPEVIGGAGRSALALQLHRLGRPARSAGCGLIFAFIASLILRTSSTRRTWVPAALAGIVAMDSALSKVCLSASDVRMSGLKYAGWAALAKGKAEAVPASGWITRAIASAACAAGAYP